MKFEIVTTGDVYKEDRKVKLEKLGFKFREIRSFCNSAWIMLDDEVFIELTTLEELIEFTDDWEDCIVSSGSIEIYDDYRE